MSTQLTFLDDSPEPARYDDMPPVVEARARRSDPESSKAAAEQIEKVAASDQRQHVIDAVWKWPGRTSKQLADLDGELDRHQFGRRLPECEEMGEIHRVKEGKAELKWFPGRAKA